MPLVNHLKLIAWLLYKSLHALQHPPLGDFLLVAYLQLDLPRMSRHVVKSRTVQINRSPRRLLHLTSLR